MTPVISMSELATLLSAQIRALCEQLFPAGVVEGHEFRVGSLAGEPGRSLAVHLSGAKAGIWADFSRDGASGDALDLIAQSLYSGNKTDAVKFARDFLGIAKADGDTVAKATSRAKREAKRQNDRREKEAAEYSRRALGLYLSGQPDLTRTPVERYLAGRGIALADLARRPGALRYHPDLWHKPAQRKFPAMLGQVLRLEPDEEGVLKPRPVGVHRTYLFIRPDRTVAKAGRAQGVGPKDAKRVMGKVKGGYIPIARGADGRSLADPKATGPLAICEGIEDALTIALVRPQIRVITCLALSMLGSLILPDHVRDVILCADNDTEAAARDAADRAIGALLSTGRTVRVARPPEGFQDFNDWWCARRAAHAAGQDAPAPSQPDEGDHDDRQSDPMRPRRHGQHG